MRRLFLLCLFTSLLSTGAIAGETATHPGVDTGVSQIQGIPQIEDFMFCEGLLEKGCALFKAKRYEEAFAQFNRWAERGEAGSMNNMGVMLEAGLGVQTDFDRARKLYLLASEADVAIAQYNLGMFLGAKYMEAAHATRKLTNAEQTSRTESLLNGYKWLRLAARQGHNKAMAGADELEPYMSKEQVKMALHRIG
ncbi:MAG: tetratricopeptide repeat protein, partial [Alphaproteobacteria bacterium]